MEELILSLFSALILLSWEFQSLNDCFQEHQNDADMLFWLIDKVNCIKMKQIKDCHLWQFMTFVWLFSVQV